MNFSCVCQPQKDTGFITCCNTHPQAWDGVFPGSPPLDPAHYKSCYGMRLDGFLAPPPAPDIQWSSASPDAATAAHTRVCIRYSDHAAVTLGGVQLACAPPGNFDATLECHDLAALPGERGSWLVAPACPVTAGSLSWITARRLSACSICCGTLKAIDWKNNGLCTVDSHTM